MKKIQSDELFPRHIRALARAVAAMLEQDKHCPHPEAELIRDAKEGMKVVRELAAQHKHTRRHRNY